MGKFRKDLEKEDNQYIVDRVTKNLTTLFENNFKKLREDFTSLKATVKDIKENCITTINNRLDKLEIGQVKFRQDLTKKIEVGQHKLREDFRKGQDKLNEKLDKLLKK